MLNEQLEQRYAPGRRENSFFVDTPDEKRDRLSFATMEGFHTYAYYPDLKTGKLVREHM